MSLALSSALEAVKFQVEPVLFTAVSQHMKKIRAAKDYTATSKETMDLSDTLRKHTGISITVMYASSQDCNAFVRLPDLDRNHPLLAGFRQHFVGSSVSILEFRKNKTQTLEGSVDLVKGKVGGIYSDLDCEVYLTMGLMETTSFNHEELAAILLHEVGHLMTYFEYIHRTVTSNYALLAVAEEIITKDTVKRIELIDATSKHFNYDADKLDGLKTTRSKDVAYTILITTHIQKVRAELGANLYDKRGCEHLADQYASRMGAGTSLVTALAKMNRRSPSRYSTAGFILFEGFKLLLTALASFAISPLVLVLILVAYDPTDKIYDDPEARMRRIRNELLGGMKDRSIPKERKERMKKDLEIIDAAMADFNDRRTFYEFLYTTFLPGIRNQTKQMQKQQELEALANNELFSKAMNFTLV